MEKGADRGPLGSPTSPRSAAVGTTSYPFLRRVVISSTQNRDITAMHVKLNELIGPVQAADSALIRTEDETDEELQALKRHATALSQTHAILTSYPGPAKTNR